MRLSDTRLLNYLSIVLFICLSTSVSLHAQHEYCGTPPGKSAWLEAYQQHPERYQKRNNEWLIIPVRVHITGEDNGTGYTGEYNIGLAFKEMNVVFEPHMIQFYVEGDYHYIDDSWYHNHEDFFIGNQMMDQYNEPNVVNMYVTAVAAGACGYFSPSGDAVVIQNGCLDPEDHTMGHELGHFLSLPHTFNGWEGNEHDPSQPAPNFIGGREVERVSGDNCASAADGFCDTPPDYLSVRWQCNNDGSSTVSQTDPDGTSFKSDGRYIMSYSTGDCRTLISEEQADAMRANISFERTDLLGSTRSYQELTDCGIVQRISPARNEVTDPGSTRFEWQNMGNVDYYTLELSLTSNFEDIITIQTTDTFYIADDLNPDDTYFWRIGGYAAHSPCLRSVGFSWFRTEEASSNTTTEHEELKIYAADGNIYMLSPRGWHSARVRLFNASGTNMMKTILNTSASQAVIPARGVSTGVYLLSIEEGSYTSVNRIWIP